MADKKPHKRDRIAPLADASSSGKVPSFMSGASSKRAAGRVREASKKAPRVQREYKRRLPSAKTLMRVMLVVITLVAALAIALAVLSNTSAFPITGIEAEATEHISAEDIATLAGVPEGTTMLNYDTAVITENLRRNPWVADVKVNRSYPDKLRITVVERKVGSLVMMSSSSVIWCLGDDNVWIEPLKVTPEGDQTLGKVALSKAQELGALLITDVPSSVEPKAGEVASDEVFTALATFKRELSEGFWSQIVTISAPSQETISCILKSGVEVSLGAATSVSTKEQVVTSLLEKYPNRITYINVRVASSPSYRLLDTESVQEGTGAIGDFMTTVEGSSSNVVDSTATGSSSDSGDATTSSTGSDDGAVTTEAATDDASTTDDESGVIYDSSYDDGEGSDSDV